MLHVSSLPSPHGIGDFGPAAISWIDRLSDAGQSWWQVLPLGPTGYDNSPYQPVSSFARNTLLISPDWLVEDGLLHTNDVAHDALPAGLVDYNSTIRLKRSFLEKVWDNFKAGVRSDLRPAYEQFCRDQSHWLDDYALFRALKEKFGGVDYLEWPVELVRRTASALDTVRVELADTIAEVSFAQFLVSRQADRLKAYASSKGLGLIGDLPFFVSADSSDVWANPDLFLLDERLRPRFVAGVPPDYFSAQGQLWGNPLYNWQNLRQTGYRWWIARLSSLLSHVDLIRLDHFRGFAAAWCVPAGAATAQSGNWVPGPGPDLFCAIKRELGGLPFIAEDLGMITKDVYVLRDQFQLPGMRVLQFAFDGRSDNPHLPNNFVRDAVAYPGTHDNPTTREWFGNLSDDQRSSVRRQLAQWGATSGDAAHGLMEVVWRSIAALAIAPLQDLLNLGKEARMNVPGRADGSWRWRCTEEMMSDAAFKWLADLTKKSDRSRLAPPESLRITDAASREQNTTTLRARP